MKDRELPAPVDGGCPRIRVVFPMETGTPLIDEAFIQRPKTTAFYAPAAPLGNAPAA